MGDPIIKAPIKPTDELTLIEDVGNMSADAIAELSDGGDDTIG